MCRRCDDENLFVAPLPTRQINLNIYLLSTKNESKKWRRMRENLIKETPGIVLGVGPEGKRGEES